MHPLSFPTLQKMDQASEAEHSLTSLPDLPPHLQHHIFASPAAPLTTCKASAGTTSDASLAATWLLSKYKEPLLQASKHQLWDVCTELLTTYSHVPTAVELQQVLPNSAQHGQTSLVSRLLQWCCQEHCNFTGISCYKCISMISALDKAVQQGHTGVCSLILQHPSSTPAQAHVAMCIAAQRGQLEVLQVLLKTHPDATFVSSDPYSTLMCSAAAGGHIPAMQLLLQHDRDTGSNICSNQAALGRAMSTATKNEHLQAVRWLLDHGGDPNQAVTACRCIGHMDILRLLLDRGANILLHGPWMLVCALLIKEPELAQLLLEVGVPTNTTVLQRLEQLQQAGTLCTYVSHFSKHQSAALLEAAVRHGHTQFAQLWGQAHAAVHGGDVAPGQLQAS
jgi:hypothetical protein